MINNTFKRNVIISSLLAVSLATLGGCTSSKDSEGEIAGIVQKNSIKQTLENSSPWATTALYLVVDGEVDKSFNYIDDNKISKGTISSAQYRDGTFMFIGMSDYKTGAFNQSALVSAINATTNGAAPSGFATGDYAMVRNGEGTDIRQVTNASFAPDATINRTITVANEDEFGYIFVASDNNTYYVEHKPYTKAFDQKPYPVQLQTAVDSLFTKKNTLKKQIDNNLKDGSPWATTAVYLQVDGQPDTSVNYINDATISAGTISSAQYRNGQFLFIGMDDYTTGDFNDDSLISSLNAVIENNEAPKGYAFGDYKVILDDSGKAVRRITNASFAASAIIDRVVTEATLDKFTYTFTKEGKTYYVEHENYAAAFPKQTYPATLQTAIDNFFTLK